MRITLLVLFVFFLLINSVRWLYRIYISSSYINQKSIKEYEKGTILTEPEICILLPVLEETTRIEKTIKLLQSYCGDIQKLHIVCVTTSREKVCHKNTNLQMIDEINKMKDISSIEEYMKEKLKVQNYFENFCERDIDQVKLNAIKLIKQRKNTIELLKDIKYKYPNLIVYHYSGDGVMAHQVNFGINSFISKHPDIKEDVLFALYNADSEIAINTLKWVMSIKENNRQAVIFQQYGNYTQNIETILKRKVLFRSILLSSSMWQCRWSYAFELFNCLSQYTSFNPFCNGLQVQRQRDCFNYCIGHGLYFDYKTFQLFGGFSEETQNEDQIFGLQASLYRIPIIPIPFFERADSPSTLKSLIIQKKTWFSGPYDAFKYRKILTGVVAGKNDKRRLLYFTIRLFEHALRWIFVPLITLGIIIYALINIKYSVFLLTFLWIYLGGINFFCYKKMNKTQGLAWHEIVLAIILSPVQFLLHGYSGLSTLVKTIFCQLTNKKMVKVKTPI